jgi:hypothetical protein
LKFRQNFFGHVGYSIIARCYDKSEFTIKNKKKLHCKL